ncbi:hypothetical protein [Rhodococcus sp. RS1C4]|nr:MULTISPECIES: hypothetical protein [unclassified Rhodococcus (in: high G+C Gram-positive bacteria)]
MIDPVMWPDGACECAPADFVEQRIEVPFDDDAYPPTARFEVVGAA